MFNFQGISQEEGHKMLCCAFQHQDAFDETFISHLLVFLYGNYPKLAPVFSLSKFFVVKSKFRAPDVDTIFKFQPHSNSNIKLEFMFFCGAGENVTEARDNLLRQIHYDVKKNEFQYSNKHLQEQIKNMSIIRTNYYYNDTNNNNNNNNNVLQNNGNNNNNNNFAQYGNNNNNNNNFAQYGNNNNNNNFAQGNNNNYNNCGNNNNNNNLQYGNNNNNNMIQYGNNHNNNNNNNNNMIESNNNNNNTIQFNNNNSVNCLDNYGNNNIVKHENDNNDILRENQNTISYFISERLENKDDVILVIKSVKAKLIQCYENGIVPDVESIAHEFDDATQKYKRFDPLWKVFVYHITQVLNAIKINDYQIGRAAVHAFIDDLHNCTQQTNH